MNDKPVILKLMPDRVDEGLRLAYHPKKFGDYEIELQLKREALETAAKANPDFEVPTDPIILARYKASTRTLTTFPISTTFGAYFLEPKYLHLETIILEDVDSPGAMRDDGYLYFEELPAGIIREPLAGFGLAYDMRFIAEATERQSGVTTLRISNDKGVSREGDVLSMSYSLFNKFRRDINRTHKRSIALANIAKRDYLDANLNIMLDPDFELPIGDGTRRPVADILAETLIGKSRSPEAEARAAARTVKRSVRTLAEKVPAELLELRREIELVSIEELIEIFDKKLSQTGLQERHWQEFLNANAFFCSSPSTCQRSPSATRSRSVAQSSMVAAASWLITQSSSDCSAI
jgi:hypothetical protein